MPSHIDHRCDHNENRKKICALCGRKINLGSKNLECFHITAVHEPLIKLFVNKNFSLDDPRFPTAMCTICRLILQQHEKNITSRPFKTMPNYEDVVLQSQSACNCYICITGRHKGQIKMKSKVAIGEILDPAIVIDPSDGVDASKNATVSEFPRREQSSKIKAKSTMTICNLCFQKVGRGLRHPCVKNTSSKARARENILKMSSSLPMKQQGQICSSLLSKKINAMETDECTTKDSLINISTTGRPKTICLKKPPKPVTFSAEELNNYQNESGHSGKQMKNIITFIRSTAGRKSIPPDYFKQVSQRAKTLENVYRSDTLEFDVENNAANQKKAIGGQKNSKQKRTVAKKITLKQRRPVVWANAEEILNTVIDKRGLIGNYLVKVMADGGQGFFKIGMTIIPEDYISESIADSDEDHSSAKKRKVDKVTSVHKLIMLAIVPAIKETYDNVKTLFDLVKINDIPFKFVSDLKLVLIVNGQQTATSSFPCPYCFVKLDSLKSRVDIDINVSCEDEEDIPISDELLYNKTYGDLRKDYEEFVSLGNDLKLASRARSTIHAPLFDEDDNVTILQKCVIPELHILQGFVNHLFWKGLVPLLGEEKALLWPRKLHLISKNYHGAAFEGNACRKLLKGADMLLTSEITDHVGGSLVVLPFIAAFKAMDKIVHSCFRVTRVQSNLNQHIGDLRTALLAIHVSESLKIHIALKHIEESLEFLNEGEGFGLWSEQAGESMHREFLKFWNRRKTNNLNDPGYLERFKAAVVDFSSKHI